MACTQAATAKCGSPRHLGTGTAQGIAEDVDQLAGTSGWVGWSASLDRLGYSPFSPCDRSWESPLGGDLPDCLAGRSGAGALLRRAQSDRSTARWERDQAFAAGSAAGSHWGVAAAGCVVVFDFSVAAGASHLALQPLDGDKTLPRLFSVGSFRHVPWTLWQSIPSCRRRLTIGPARSAVGFLIGLRPEYARLEGTNFPGVTAGVDPVVGWQKTERRGTVVSELYSGVWKGRDDAVS